MRFRQIFSMAIDSLKGAMLRTGLTIFSVSIGVFSIVFVMTVIDVLSQAIEGGLMFMGSNTFQVSKVPAIITDRRELMKYNMRPDITFAQVQAFERMMEGEAEISPVAEYQKNRLPMVSIEPKMLLTLSALTSTE